MGLRRSQSLGRQQLRRQGPSPGSQREGEGRQSRERRERQSRGRRERQQREEGGTEKREEGGTEKGETEIERVETSRARWSGGSNGSATPQLHNHLLAVVA